jgi:hypothetical protein
VSFIQYLSLPEVCAIVGGADQPTIPGVTNASSLAAGAIDSVAETTGFVLRFVFDPLQATFDHIGNQLNKLTPP